MQFKEFRKNVIRWASVRGIYEHGELRERLEAIFYDGD